MLSVPTVTIPYALIINSRETLEADMPPIGTCSGSEMKVHRVKRHKSKILVVDLVSYLGPPQSVLMWFISHLLKTYGIINKVTSIKGNAGQAGVPWRTLGGAGPSFNGVVKTFQMNFIIPTENSSMNKKYIFEREGFSDVVLDQGTKIRSWIFMAAGKAMWFTNVPNIIHCKGKRRWGFNENQKYQAKGSYNSMIFIESYPLLIMTRLIMLKYTNVRVTKN